MYCKNCNQEVTTRYCGHCGDAVHIHRVDGHYVRHEILHVLHFEKGIGYTVLEMLLRPGQAIRTFLLESRSRLVKPVIYLIITSLIYTIVSHLLHTPGKNIAGPEGVKSVMEWVEQHYGYANIVMGIFIAAWLKLFSRKSGYNFYEIMVMLCFVMGTGMLLCALFSVVEQLAGLQGGLVGNSVALVYSVWAIAQFLGGKKVRNYGSASLAYFLGMGTFILLAGVAGIMIELFRMH